MLWFSCWAGGGVWLLVRSEYSYWWNAQRALLSFQNIKCPASLALSTRNRCRISAIAVDVPFISFCARTGAHVGSVLAHLSCLKGRISAYVYNCSMRLVGRRTLNAGSTAFRSLPIFHVEMRFLFKSLSHFLFIASTSPFSLPPSLSLIVPNSSNLNSYTDGSFSNLTSKTGIVCSITQGKEMSIDSCNNAWEKIQPTSHSQRFLPRKTDAGEVTNDDVIMPLRYLSDDGICAIVRCPSRPLLTYCISS